MDRLAERVQRIEAQICVLKDEKFDHKSRSKELEMKLSQSEERIKELEKTVQTLRGEDGYGTKENVFKPLERRVLDLDRRQQQLHEQMEQLRVTLDSMSKKSEGTKTRHGSHDNETGGAYETPRLPPRRATRKVRAIQSYEATYEYEMSFEEDDLLEIDDGNTVSKDWLMAINVKSRKKGLIPASCIIKEATSCKTHDWLVEYSCKDFEKRMLFPGNPQGTFLIKEEAVDKSSYVLSVRISDNDYGDPRIKHYRIYTMDNEQGYFIRPNKPFSSLVDLVSHYQDKPDGLFCKLTTPCPNSPAVVPFSDLVISRHSVQISNELGLGQFSWVRRGTLHEVVDVAVKVQRVDATSSKDFLNKAKVMHRLRHNSLVQLLAVVSDEEPFYIITDFMVNGALTRFLRTEKGKSLKFGEIIVMNTQITDGMSYLEKIKVIHCDLRADNILVGRNFEVKIAGFGLARVLEGDEYLLKAEDTFPVKWTAPEVFGSRKFTLKSDVWSFGVLMYQLITVGKIPYPGMTIQDVLSKVSNGWRMEKPVNGPIQVPDSYYDLMLKCWHKVPEQRPTFESLRDTFDDYNIYHESFQD